MKHNINYDDVLNLIKNPFKNISIVSEQTKIYLNLNDFHSEYYCNDFITYTNTIEKEINLCNTINEQLNNDSISISHAFFECVKKFRHIEDIMKILNDDAIKSIHGHCYYVLNQSTGQNIYKDCEITVNDHGRFQSMNSCDIITGWISLKLSDTLIL
jgi:hypothetical protein